MDTVTFSQIKSVFWLKKLLFHSANSLLKIFCTLSWMIFCIQKSDKTDTHMHVQQYQLASLRLTCHMVYIPPSIAMTDRAQVVAHFQFNDTLHCPMAFTMCLLGCFIFWVKIDTLTFLPQFISSLMSPQSLIPLQMAPSLPPGTQTLLLQVNSPTSQMLGVVSLEWRSNVISGSFFESIKKGLIQSFTVLNKGDIIFSAIDQVGS